MILLTSTSDVLRVVTDAAGDIEPHASYLTNNAGTVTPGRTNTASITTATTTTVVAAPGASQERNVKQLSLHNNHASQAVTVTVEHFDGTTAEVLAKCVLAAGERLSLDAAGIWTHYDANGGPYVGIGPVATQAEMEAGTSTTVVVTPGRQHYHKSAVKAWGQFTAAGATTAGYNVDTPTDNGTGDITVNFTTDFSAANAYAVIVQVEMTATTYAVANARTPHIRSGGLAAGTCRCDCIDGTATTQLVKDPTSWHVHAAGDHA